MDVEAIIKAVLLNLVRVGTVRVVDAQTRKARVWYDDLGIVSGWLSVLQLYGAAVEVAGDGRHSHGHSAKAAEGHTHEVSDSAADGHWHSGTTVAGWMPEAGARVLVLYLPVFNGDGFILGGL